MRRLRLAAVLVFALALLLFSTSGAFLVVNDPRYADLIVVVAGETDSRPAKGLELMRQGYAPKLMLDVPANAKIFGEQTIHIAQTYVNALPQRERVSICPIVGLSTKTEAQDVKKCLAAMPARRILLVTSDYHTRRAVSVFRRELPDREFFVAGADDPTQFGGRWWEHRQWAKINFDEWLRLVWWEAVDRWRS